jgi:hypothetical protein
MNYTESLAMSDWFFSTAMGVIGNCRHLAHIQCWQPPTTSAQSFIDSPRNNALKHTTRHFFFRLKLRLRSGKSFSGVEKAFPLLDAYNDRISRRNTFHYQVS